MSNEVLTPDQNVAPAVPVVAPIVAPVAAPVVAPAMASATPAVPVLPKASHKRLYILLIIFTLMSSAVSYVAVQQPNLLTAMIKNWIVPASEPLQAAAPESRVLVNGEWVESANPEAELAKEKKPVIPNVVKTTVEVTAPAEVPATPEAPVAEPVVAPEQEAAPEATATPDAGAFDLGSAEKETVPVVPAATEPVVEKATQ